MFARAKIIKNNYLGYIYEIMKYNYVLFVILFFNNKMEIFP